MPEPLIVGIDPDLIKNGVAIVRCGKLEELHSMTFFDLQRFIHRNPDAVYVVEDVEINKPIFNRGLKVLENLKVAQNVGMVKGVARLIIDYLEYKDCRFLKVRPLTGRFKQAKEGKNARVHFQRLTGWTASSNADKRDAALLALYGIKPGQLAVRPSEVPH